MCKMELFDFVKWPVLRFGFLRFGFLLSVLSRNLGFFFGGGGGGGGEVWEGGEERD